MAEIVDRQGSMVEEIVVSTEKSHDRAQVRIYTSMCIFIYIYIYIFIYPYMYICVYLYIYIYVDKLDSLIYFCMASI
jgi:hypothetical protein